MSQTFPTSVPSYPDTTGGEVLGSAGGGLGLSRIIDDYGLDITALAAKLGTGSDTAANGQALMGNGAGTSEWRALVKADVGLGNVDNTSDATKQSATVTAALLAAFPVGSIYINTSNTNPGTFIGGTWVAFGAGRVPVGFDSGQTEFDTDEETGGAKTHTLTIAEMPAHTHSYNDPEGTGIATGAPSGGQWNVNQTGSTGGGGAHNNLQPYIVVRMWKRTA